MSAPVLAAGAVCWRVTRKGRVKVLVVHRTQHRDVSLPKGKLDPGETLPETAVREIAEETGLMVALGAPLGVVEYRLPTGRDKKVYYWAAEAPAHAIANSTFVANDEIEDLRWMTVEKARRRLSYPHDVDIVERFRELYEQGRARTFAIIALRHAKAVPGEDWDGPDATRPLQSRGSAQAQSIAPAVAAYRPKRLLSSTAVRCLSTSAPVARFTGLDVSPMEALSQDAWERSADNVRRIVRARIEDRVTTVLCSHGPVLPQILRAVAEFTASGDTVSWHRAASLSTAEYAVVHVSADRPDSGVVAVEIHGPSA